MDYRSRKTTVSTNAASKYPSQALISIGATAYAEFGEKNYLQSGDEVFVIAYDATVDNDSFSDSPTKVVLHQKVS